MMSVVRQRPVSDVGGLVLRHDLHEPGPDHGALPRGVSAPQVQGALQGLWQKFSTFIRFQYYFSVNFIYKEVLGLYYSSHGYLSCPQYSEIS